MNEIIIDVGFNQIRVAVLENNELVELYIEREDNKRVLGNIYKGRVINVLPGMEAAFVDIGLEKNAFLYIKDAIPKDNTSEKDISKRNLSIRDVVKQGQEIIVQVIREPFGTKGARVTTHITLPGRYLVLMPHTDYIGISRRITNEEERNRLKSLIEEIRDENIGAILRTAAENRTKEELKDDFKFLSNIFKKFKIERNLGSTPRIIFRDLDIIHRTVRDLFTKSTKRLIINDKDKYDSIIDLVDITSSSSESRIEYYDKSHNIFGDYGIESMIKDALSRKVWLKSGGYIVIDETEALTSIDVNTGKYVGSVDLEHTVLRTNIEAAKVIAKQLRLRNIGGIIIIDFIDLQNKDDEKLLLETLERELKKDRTRTTVLGMTRLGLVEMTRKKNRKRLTSRILRECPYCEGTGRVYSEYTVINSLEREIKRTKIHTNAEAVLIEVNPSIYKVLINNQKEYLNRLEEKYGIKLFIDSDDSIHFNNIKVKHLPKASSKK